MSNLNRLQKKVANLKEISPDDRIEIENEILECEDQLSEIREILRSIPDTEPEEGLQDRRMIFVEKLMEESEKKDK